MSRDELKPGDYVFLCFLLHGPATAYDIKRGMAGSVSFFWTAAHSQVYAQAARLVRDGYVREKAAAGARRKRILSLAPKGRAAVTRWLSAPAGETQLYDESLVKLFFAAFAEPGSTLQMLEAQEAEHRRTLADYEAIRPALVGGGGVARNALATLELGIAVERAWLRWLDETKVSLVDSPRRRRTRKD